MTVKKTKSGYSVTHCKGKKKGTVIAKHRTKKKALAQHRVIKASQARRKPK